MHKSHTEELTEKIFTLTRLMKHEMSFADNFIHLSILQIQALFFLAHHEGATMGDLAGHFRIELPSATSLADKLCDKKLVGRLEDPGDRRLVRLTLTAEGKQLLEKAMSNRKQKVEKMLSYLSDREKTELLTILTTLSQKLK